MSCDGFKRLFSVTLVLQYVSEMVNYWRFYKRIYTNSLLQNSLLLCKYRPQWMVGCRKVEYICKFWASCEVSCEYFCEHYYCILYCSLRTKSFTIFFVIQVKAFWSAFPCFIFYYLSFCLVTFVYFACELIHGTPTLVLILLRSNLHFDKSAK